MRLAVIADIHGNCLALDAVLADIARRGVRDIVNLGDVASGPMRPRETVARIIGAGIPTVRGNHDRWVAEGTTGGSDAFARDRLDPAQRAWLGALPVTLALAIVGACTAQMGGGCAGSAPGTRRLAGSISSSPKAPLL